jgi:hypothetical protein
LLSVRITSLQRRAYSPIESTAEEIEPVCGGWLESAGWQATSSDAMMKYLLEALEGASLMS